MKTSEDKLNEALRDVLKRKFDDYEEQPQRGAYERIRARVKPLRGWKYWWLTGGLVLITVSGLLVGRYAGGNGTGHVASGQASLDRQNALSEATNAVAADVITIREAGKASKYERVKQDIESNRLKTARTWAGASGVLKADNVSANRTEAKELLRNQDYKNTGKSGIAVGGEKPFPGNDAHAIAEVPVTTGVLPDVLGTVDADSAAHEIPLEALAGIPLSELNVRLQPRTVALPARTAPAKVIVTNPSRTTWLFNAAALHSYQILTVPSSAALDFQNFNFPTLFAMKSIGYKLSAGIERKGVQVQLHYSDFRQTYSYEVANNNYLVKPDDKGAYQTIRQGDRITEDRKFSLLGIGVSKQIRWGHSPVSRFYTTVGLEYSRALNSSQNLGWVSLGLGKQVAISRHTAFSIGPYAEFSPIKVKGFANPFYYQPYRVGISVGLRFVKP